MVYARFLTRSEQLHYSQRLDDFISSLLVLLCCSLDAMLTVSVAYLVVSALKQYWYIHVQC